MDDSDHHNIMTDNSGCRHYCVLLVRVVTKMHWANNSDNDKTVLLLMMTTKDAEKAKVRVANDKK